MDVCLHTFWDITHDFIGGTERFLIELSKELKALGYRPFIVCSGNNVKTNIEGVPVFGVLPPKYVKSFVSYGEAKSSFLHDNFSNNKTFLQGLKELGDYVNYQTSCFSYDVVHLNSFASSIFYKSDIPVVVTNHENEKESDNIWGVGFFDEMISIVKKHGFLKNHHARIVPSAFYAQKYTKQFGMDIISLNLGINLINFYRQNKKIRTEKGSTKILLPSRLAPKQKGHDIALEACKKLNDNDMQIEIIFSGLRKDHKENAAFVRNRAKELGIIELITIKSYASIQTGFEEADIVISPERYCSYGLSISEALAMGKQTILSDIPTYLEIAEGYQHAHFFKSGCSDSLAEKIADLAKKEFEPKSSDIIRFRTKYDMRECAKGYSNIYLDTMK